ncbi:tetratricopeptide repeat protein [Streptomyces sp. NPDC001851]|uniref:tetratricopeptide repeat protein n=1 Tax=Streptomyces sp. NPDC001851 TaxID=3154529 RepID=UPI00332A580B
MAYQIPPEPAHFVDREREQATARRLVAERQTAGGAARPLCLLLSGYAGTGKTELAFRLARALHERYPEGVLYVDLDDVRRGGAVEVADVLGDLLRGLGAEWIAPVFRERARQYWSLTHGGRLVVIVDNARYGTEVEPLLPASGDSLVIVTSHGPLYDLQAGAATELPLGPLEPADALDLLERVTRDARLSAEPEQTRTLLALCAGLPAALHVAGQWLRRHPGRSLARLLGRLTSELHDKGIPEVEQVWDAAYDSIGPDAARLYRLLGSFPGPSFTLAAADALLGRGAEAAEDALDELRAAGLLDGRSTDGRQRLPELLRAHARRRAEGHGDPVEREQALRRLVRWYLRQAQRADLAAAGPRLRTAAPVEPVPGTTDVLFDRPGDTADGTAARAYRWLEAERHALFGCVRLAHAAGAAGDWGPEEASALCEPLWTHFLNHPHHGDHIDAFRTGVAAAQRAGDPRTLVRMRCQLARPLWEQEEFEEAERQLGQAWSTVRAAFGTTPEERKLAASTWEFTGMLRSARGDWAGAAEEFAAARAVHEEIGNTYGVVLQTYRLGEALARLGELERAEALLAQARTWFAEDGRTRLTARAEFALGGVRAGLGRTDEARELYLSALSGTRAVSGARDEARVLDALAGLAADAGRQAEAEEHRAAARDIRARLGLA